MRRYVPPSRFQVVTVIFFARSEHRGVLRKRAALFSISMTRQMSGFVGKKKRPQQLQRGATLVSWHFFCCTGGGRDQGRTGDYYYPFHPPPPPAPVSQKGTSPEEEKEQKSPASPPESRTRLRIFVDPATLKCVRPFRARSLEMVTKIAEENTFFSSRKRTS